MHRSTTVLLATLVVTAGFTAPSVADDDGVLVDLLDGEDDGAYARLTAWLDGVVNRLFDGGPPDDLSDSEAAADLQAEFNARSSAFQSWANDRTTADTDADVFALEFDVDDDGDVSTVYLTADVNGSDYENASIEDSTDRSVDETCTLSAEAAASADEELETFREEFVDEERDVTRSYQNRLASQYAGQVDCSFSLTR